MCSTQVTNSPRSVGRVGVGTRCTCTPPRSSSSGSAPSQRVRTWTSTPWVTSPRRACAHGAPGHPRRSGGTPRRASASGPPFRPGNLLVVALEQRHRPVVERDPLERHAAGQRELLTAEHIPPAPARRLRQLELDAGPARARRASGENLPAAQVGAAALAGGDWRVVACERLGPSRSQRQRALDQEQLDRLARRRGAASQLRQRVATRLPSRPAAGCRGRPATAATARRPGRCRARPAPSA